MSEDERTDAELALIALVGDQDGEDAEDAERRLLQRDPQAERLYRTYRNAQRAAEQRRQEQGITFDPFGPLDQFGEPAVRQAEDAYNAYLRRLAGYPAQ